MEQFEDGPWPAVRHDQRQRVRMRRTDVDEVNVKSIDRGDELRQRVELRFCLSPVVLGLPVAYQFPDRRQLHALRLIPDRLAFREARRSEALAKVDEYRFWNMDPKRSDAVVIG